jgi:CRISPR-associated endoribonuclease Cas6
MKLKIILTKPNINIPINNQKELNSFIHRCLGKDNEWHDKFSDYSISSLQGGKLINNYLIFDDYPYIICNTDNISLITKLLQGLNENHSIFDMKFKKVEITEVKVNKFYDKVVTISPILLKDVKTNTKLTYKDGNWLSLLIKQSKSKLLKCGIEDDTFDIKIRNILKAKTKTIYVGDVFNPTTMISLIIYGKPKTRQILYNMGLGNSTGSGFGSIKIYE